MNNSISPEEVTAYESNGLVLLTDSMDYAGHDRVLPIIPDEQPLICSFLRLTGKERVIDAGTGCGVLALYAARCGCDVKGIDVLERAIAIAEINAHRNILNVTWERGAYLPGSAPPRSADLVVFNPPHHPTPPGVNVAVHADGGDDGLSVFRQFLLAASVHVVIGGRIVFFQLSVAREGTPKLVEDISRVFPGGWRARIQRILPTVSSRWFLSQVYDGSQSQWIRNLTLEYPDVDLVLGEIVNAGSATISWLPVHQNACTWAERIELHRKILQSCTETTTVWDQE